MEWGRLPSDPLIEASSTGLVRWKGGKERTGTWRKWVCGQGRYVVVFGRRNYTIARLVCEAFHGLPPAGAVCMHINEDSRDNRPENLRWGTQKENLNAPGFLAYCRKRTSENNPYTKGRAHSLSR